MSNERDRKGNCCTSACCRRKSMPRRSARRAARWSMRGATSMPTRRCAPDSRGSGRSRSQLRAGSAGFREQPATPTTKARPLHRLGVQVVEPRQAVVAVRDGRLRLLLHSGQSGRADSLGRLRPGTCHGEPLSPDWGDRGIRPRLVACPASWRSRVVCRLGMPSAATAPSPTTAAPSGLSRLAPTSQRAPPTASSPAPRRGLPCGHCRGRSGCRGRRGA